MADEKPAVALPTCSILDTNVLVSATASQRELHGTAQSVMRWPAFGRQIYISGQILREYLWLRLVRWNPTAWAWHPRMPLRTCRRSVP